MGSCRIFSVDLVARACVRVVRMCVCVCVCPLYLLGDSHSHTVYPDHSCVVMIRYIGYWGSSVPAMCHWYVHLVSP